MLSSKRRVLTIVLVLTIFAIVGAMVLSACQIKLNNPPEDNDNVDTPNDEQGTTQEPEQDTTQHPEQDADTTPDVTPDPKPPIVEQTTEAEYKSMFEAELPRVIENDFNKNITKENLKIKNAEVVAINNLTGCAYVKCERNGANRFYEFTSELLKGQDSFKSLYENLDSITFEHSSPQTVQEDTLANEIAEFALEQAEVVNYLAENGIDAGELKVLNATEFLANNDGYRNTTLTIVSENSIFTINLAGGSGVCSTQEEYLTKFKNGYLEIVTIGDAIEYKQLTVA